MDNGFDSKYTEPWDDGVMLTERERLTSEGKLADEIRVIKGKILPGEYRNEIFRDQELTVLSGTVTFIQESDGKRVRFETGEKFMLYEGRIYDFEIVGEFTFSCTYR